MPVWLGSPFGNFVVLRQGRASGSPGPGPPPPPPPPPPGNVFNVMDYGAHADGATDDVGHIQNAITAASGGTVYFPAGTYYLASSLTVPNGTHLTGLPVSALAYPVSGCNTPTSWIKGPLRFGSNSTFSDLRIGTQNSTVCNASGASSTSFTRCQFRGGGGSGAPGFTTFMLGGQAGSCEHITLSDCNVERCMATDSQRNADYGNKFYCDFIINARISGESVHYVTVNGCHIGTSNGMTSGQGVAVNTGSPQATFLCWTARGAGTATWDHIYLTDTVIEVGEWDCVDLADYRDGSVCNTMTFTHCLLKGASSNTICIEGPQYIEFDRCTFGRGNGSCMYLHTYGSESTRSAYYDIHDCTFDMLTNYGVGEPWDRYGAHIHLKAGGNAFTNNVINANGHVRLFFLNTFHDSTFSGNTFNDHLTSPDSPAPFTWTAESCTNVSHTSDNLFHSYSSTNPTFYSTGITNCDFGATYTHN